MGRPLWGWGRESLEGTYWRPAVKIREMGPEPELSRERRKGDQSLRGKTGWEVPVWQGHRNLS